METSNVRNASSVTIPATTEEIALRGTGYTVEEIRRGERHAYGSWGPHDTMDDADRVQPAEGKGPTAEEIALRGTGYSADEIRRGEKHVHGIWGPHDTME